MKRWTAIVVIVAIIFGSFTFMSYKGLTTMEFEANDEKRITCKGLEIAEVQTNEMLGTLLAAHEDDPVITAQVRSGLEQLQSKYDESRQSCKLYLDSFGIGFN